METQRKRCRLFFALTLTCLLVIHVIPLRIWPALCYAAGPADPVSPFRSHPSLGYLTGGFSPGPFRFVLASDSHFGSAVGNRGSSLAFESIRRNHSNASFLVHMGDITETGALSEYDLYDSFASELPFPVFNTPGNHESRWQDRFARVFFNRYGVGSYSFNYKGWHFVVLDTSYPGQTYGTLEPSTLEWLERDLQELPSGRPVAIFAHHPLFYEPRRFQDSDDVLLPILERYPVQALFCGHGHTFLHWRAQGRDLFMVGALMDGAYAVVEVSPGEMRVYAEKVVAPQASQGSDGGESAVERSLLGIVRVKPQSSLGNPILSMSASPGDDGRTIAVDFELLEEAEVYYQIDGGPFVPLGSKETGSHKIQLDISGHAKGLHTIRLKAHFSGREGPYYAACEFGKLEEDLVRWKLDLGSAVTDLWWASPGRLIAGTRDGRAVALDIATGRRMWEYNESSAYCGGTTYGGKLCFTTAAGEIICLDALSGSFRWKVTLDEFGFASPPTLVSNGRERMLVAGASSGKVYALDLASGLLKWSFQSRGAITGGVAAGENLVLFGSWGNQVHALDASTGKTAWGIPLGRQIYYSPAGMPLVTGGTVYTAIPFDGVTGASFVYAFDVSGGGEVLRLPFSESMLGPTAGLSSSVARDVLSAGYGLSAGRVPPAALKNADRLILLGSSGSVTVCDPRTGETAGRLQGDGTLFSTVANLDHVYVSGGARGLINIFVDGVKVDYKVRDCFLFTNPLVAFVPPAVIPDTAGEETGYTVIVSDTRGTVWAIAVPAVR